MDSIRVAVAQLNTVVGDAPGNAAKAADAIDKARELQCEIIALPELCVTGYPPEDLLLSDAFIDANLVAVEQLAAKTRDIVAAIGFVDREESAGESTPKLYNAAAIATGGELASVHHKWHLPNYGVFDERRYFQPGRACQVIEIDGIKVGFSICEDIWVQPGPADAQCLAGANLVVCLNASPFELGKLDARVELMRAFATRYGSAGVYVNQVGGQDELVFDGASFVIAPDGELHAVAPQWQESVIAFDVPVKTGPKQKRNGSEEIDGQEVERVAISVGARLRDAKPALDAPSTTMIGHHEDIYSALLTGTRDYVRKTGFSKVAVAISGGIDSALVATIAADSLGAENIVGVTMPSRYSSDGSVSDSETLAANLGIPLWNVPIEPAHDAFDSMLATAFMGTDPNTAEENVQARIRGNVMMTIANKFGWLVLTTGNKSEMATGYATLYGDMAGGFAVIKDIPKQLVYELAKYRNDAAPDNPPIPQAIIDKPPSAELKPDQTDQDSLPDYEALDAILAAYVEQRKSPEQIVDDLAPRWGGDRVSLAQTVQRVVSMVDRNEYKRRQAPPGIKITGLAFGRDRRMPIASAWGS